MSSLTNRALVYEQYGESTNVLQLQSNLPVRELEADELLIKVYSAAVNPVDWKVHTGKAIGLVDTKPSKETPAFIGFDVSGVVEQLGSKVESFNIGDAVYAMAPFDGMGSIAEYFIIKANLVAKKPEILSHNEAASLPLVALTSYQSIFNNGEIKENQKVLILNGSGGTGNVAIQLAHSIGAYVVTTTSEKNIEFVKSLGADEVVDYTKSNYYDVLEANSFDLIYDCIYGTQETYQHAQKLLKPNTGKFISILGFSIKPTPDSRITFRNVLVTPNGEELTKIAQFVQKGQLKPVIDSVFPFEESIEALLKLQTGRAKGKIVIQIKNE